VIGAGAAGIAAARRIMAANRKVASQSRSAEGHALWMASL
jgi:cation diffusion facilitator CzcD-associated flavoprotein CzcO